MNKIVALESINLLDKLDGMIELKRCPICNREVVFEICHCKHEEWFGRTITCRHCDLIFYGSMDGMSEEQLAEEWNTRKPMERIVERLESMQDNLPAELSHCHEFYVEGMFEGLNRGIKIVKEEGGL